MASTNREANSRLATYGSLSPGRANDHELAGLRGNWRVGTVRGRLMPEGWGATMGYPGLILDPLGPQVDVYLFESPDLPHHWERLDEFEGSGYQRVTTQVWTPAGELEACIYVLATARDSSAEPNT
jgi:gamma-glutamylcyclotransferase (GGCT)/AIG2-like uncharacterized protein YtfP